MNRYFSSVLLVAFLLLCSNSAHACLCLSNSVKERVKVMKKKADAIFTGEVKSVMKESGADYKVVFEVSRSWKENNINEYTLYTKTSGCGVWFEEGKTYLVYAKNNENNLLVTEICWGTGIIEYAGKDIKILGKPLFVNRD